MTKILMVEGSWCSSCKSIKPFFLSLDNEILDVNFDIIDADENRELVKSWGVRSLPTFLKFKRGKLYDKITTIDKNELLTFIKK